MKTTLLLPGRVATGGIGGVGGEADVHILQGREQLGGETVPPAHINQSFNTGNCVPFRKRKRSLTDILNFQQSQQKGTVQGRWYHYPRLLKFY